MNNDLGNSLDKWVDQLEQGMNFTASDKTKITGAGAEVYAQVLHDMTPRSNVTYKRGRSAGHANAKHHNSHRKTKHLQDTITYKAGYTADNANTGDTDIGWEDHYYDFLAKIINNGTSRKMSSKELHNVGFIERAQKEAAPQVTKAIGEAIKGVMNNDSNK